MPTTSFRLALAEDRAQLLPDHIVQAPGLPLSVELQAMQVTAAKQLSNPLRELRQAWQIDNPEGQWDLVAPSLVVGWLLAHVGGLQFLRLINLKSAVLDLVPADLEQATALSFFRVSPANGVAHLIGHPYADGWQARQLLAQKQVISSLASVDADNEFIMLGGAEEALRLLGAYSVEGRTAFNPGTFRIILPVLAPAMLATVNAELASFSEQMAAVWSKLVDAIRAEAGTQAMTPAQWLHYFSNCLSVMANTWLEQELLPPVTAWQAKGSGGWFARLRAPKSKQVPCGLCFWRDLDSLWELGHDLAQQHL